ncbi:MAG: thioredoxin fold domain-containing protein [Helicobacter sp.]|nr:thioredoxin fold domain-containing protein [Helicobacter sp.]
MRIWQTLFILAAFMVSACEKESDNIVSLGSEMSATEIEKINNLDRASYAELEGIIKDNRTIDPEGKYLMIIFGVNGCLYCDQLKKTIKNSEEIQDKLKQNFAPYYINFSYIKPHQFVTNLTPKPIITTDLVRIYRVGPTPMIIFANQDSQTIFTHTGAIDEKQLLAMLDFVASQEWKGAKDEKDINTRLLNFIQERLQ